MTILGRFRIKTLLTGAVAVIAATLVIGAVWQVFFIYIPLLNGARSIAEANAMSDYILRAAQFQARERTLSRAVTASSSITTQVREQLAQSRRRGDSALREALQVAERLERKGWGGERFTEHLAGVRDQERQLERWRSQVDSGDADVAPKPIDALINGLAELRVVAFTPTNDLHAAAFDNITVKETVWVAAEYLNREQALVAGAIAAGRGLNLSLRRRLAAERGIAARQLAYLRSSLIPFLSDPSVSQQAADVAAAWERVEGALQGPFQTMRAAVDRSTDGVPLPLDLQGWLTTSGEAVAAVQAVSAAVSRDAGVHTSAAGNMASLLAGGAVAVTTFDLSLSIGVLLLVGYVVRRIGEPDRILSRLHRDNDLTGRIPDEGRDELAGMARSFNAMMVKLNEFTTGVVQAVVAVSRITERVSDSSDQADHGITRQHRDISRVAEVMEHMGGTVRRVVADGTRANAAAVEADEVSQQGRQVVAETIANINDLVSRVEGVAEIIGRLGEQSAEIGQVIEVIGGIAEQTNLLALNAAIEAARAGEQGRGFAVVADEVRALASRTQEATGEVGRIVGALQQQVTKAGHAMRDSRSQAQRTLDQTGRTDAALGRILGAVGTIRSLNSGICDIADNQREAAEEMQERIGAIADVAASTRQLGRHTVEATAEIADAMDQLRTLVARFKVDREVLDLSRARAAHLAWKGRLRRFLDGEGGLSREQVVSHRHCALGSWYYGDGMERYGHINEMRALEDPHERLHQIISRVVDLWERDNKEQAEHLFQEVEPLSRHIVDLLNQIEERANAAASA